MKRNIQFLILASTLATSSIYAQTVCVFDPSGSTGQTSKEVAKYVEQAKQWGVNLETKHYTDERIASENFKSAKCDMAVLTGSKGRQYNKYVGTIDAIGLVNDESHHKIYRLLGDKRIAKRMVQRDYEVVGASFLDVKYPIFNSDILTIRKGLYSTNGKNIAVKDTNRDIYKLINFIGAEPKVTDRPMLSNTNIKFATTSEFVTFEQDKKYRILNVPVANVSNMYIIRKDKFPSDYGQKSRTWVSENIVNKPFSVYLLPRLVKLNTGSEPKYIDQNSDAISLLKTQVVSAESRKDDVKLLRMTRNRLAKEGYYSKSMLKLVNKIGCQKYPKVFVICDFTMK